MKNTSTIGAAMILFVLFFAFASSAMMFALAQSIFSDLSDFNRLTQSKQSFLVSESLTEDVVYRRVFGTFSIDTTESLTINGVTASSTTSYDSPSDIYTVDTTAQLGSTIRKSQVEMSIAGGSAFNYGLQAGTGGIDMANSARVIGNVYANGTVIGAGSSEILGDVVSAGPTGMIIGVHATGSVYANTIDNVDTDVDAHYNINLNGSTWSGTEYSPAVNQPTTTFPISTTTIQGWKDSIITYGTTIASTDPACSTGTYTIDTSITIGYLKVECNVDIEKTGPSTVVTLDGPIWVEGNLSFTQGPTMEVDPSLGRLSVQMIADNPSNRSTSSQIEIRNSTDFNGSGDSRSYIMLLSLNESASNSGSEFAIKFSQSANGSIVAYADTGLIDIGNGIDLKAVTGYQIDIAQNSDVYYETGLASLLFASGPGGAYVPNDWQQAE